MDNFKKLSKSKTKKNANINAPVIDYQAKLDAHGLTRAQVIETERKLAKFANTMDSLVRIPFTKQGMGASGSDTLYKYLFHMAVKMPLNRSMVLEAIENIFANFGWWSKYSNDFNQIGFVDAQIMRQSDNHTGLTNSIAQ